MTSKTIKARFAGECPQCRVAVRVGDALQKVTNGKSGSAWLCPPCADLMERLWAVSARLSGARHPYVSTMRAGVRYLDGRDFGRPERDIEQAVLVADLEAQMVALQAEKQERGW